MTSTSPFPEKSRPFPAALRDQLIRAALTAGDDDTGLASTLWQHWLSHKRSSQHLVGGVARQVDAVIAALQQAGCLDLGPAADAVTAGLRIGRVTTLSPEALRQRDAEIVNRKPATAAEQIDDLCTRLVLAQVSTCTCLTKTPELEHHDRRCPYRLHAEAERTIRALQAQLRDQQGDAA